MVFKVVLLTTMLLSKFIQAGLIPDSKVEALEKVIGYEFTDKLLLEEAMIHSSCGIIINNERLAWIGDAMIYSITSKQIFDAFPEAKTEDLHNRRIILILRKTLYANAVSPNFNIEDYLQVCSNGIEAPSRDMLAEFFEAIFGAIFEDTQSLKTVYDIYTEKFPLKNGQGMWNTHDN
eukprot:TRINITY_DN2963_c0_g1_i15.p2 TRINITY_DN2963_c0_g1~~TRINITY_DN2963_c0_g1_i15.p2  ORF type:complete len:203 (-),score=17.62 TRINITY_DN2963_c0_g1_i15:1263-1793(-)